MILKLGGGLVESQGSISYASKAVYVAKAVKNIELAKYDVQFKIKYLKN